MKKIYIIISILLSLFSCFFLSNIYINSTKSKQQLDFINNVNSDYIVYYNGDVNLNNDFRYLNKSFSLYTSMEKVKSDIIMMKKNATYDFKIGSINIEKDEVCISMNIAQKYNLKVGDELLMISAFSDKQEKYYVKKIIEPCYGISSDYLTELNGLIILAYDEKVYSAINDSVAFVNEKQTLNSLNISSIISLNKYHTNLKKNIFKNNIITFFILLIIQILFILIIHIFDKNYLRFKIKNGCRFTKLLLNYPFFYTTIILVYIVLFELINFLFIFLKMNYLVFNLIPMLSLPIMAIVIFLIFKIQLRRI